MALLLATAMAAGALTGCGSSSGAGETSTETSSKSEEAVVETSGETDNTDTESGEESSSAESDIAELSPEEEAAVGTYLGAYGSYITLHKDRTADYYMALDTIKTGTWEISDGKIRVETSAWVIAADAQEDEDSQYTFTSVSGDWEDEYFKKVTSDDTSYTEDGYLELREQTVPIADKKQRKGFDEASNSTLEIGDGTLSIPEYWGDPSSDDSPVYYYVQDGTPFTMFMISTLSFDDEEETKAIWQEDAVYASLLSGYMSGADNTVQAEPRIRNCHEITRLF